jgi:hypothetical protein
MLVLGINTRNLRPLQAQQILSNVPPKIVGFSRGCNIAPLSDGEDWQAPPKFRKLSGLGPVYLEFYRAQCTPYYSSPAADAGSPKRVIICWAGMPEPGLRSEDIAPGRPGMGTPVWVSCNCRYFRYVCEWALTRYGSSDIVYSNGQPARITNPGGVGTTCKHVYQALIYSIRHWSDEPPEETAVEEPDVVQPPPVPVVEPQGEPPEPMESEPVVVEVEQQAPPRGASVSQRLRSVAYSFDQECC